MDYKAVTRNAIQKGNRGGQPQIVEGKTPYDIDGSMCIAVPRLDVMEVLIVEEYDFSFDSVYGIHVGSAGWAQSRSAAEQSPKLIRNVLTIRGLLNSFAGDKT